VIKEVVKSISFSWLVVVFMLCGFIHGIGGQPTAASISVLTAVLCIKWSKDDN